METLQLRPAQKEILTYRSGRMAVSAVPGSGKTFTLSLLAAQLIEQGHVDAEKGQQVLIVTYMNSSVDHFRSRISERLEGMGLEPAGFEVRTLHSLGLEIVRLARGGDDRSSVGMTNDLLVLDEAQSNLYLNRAIDNWRLANLSLWYEFQPDGDQRAQNRWRRIVERTASAFIRTAKNQRYRPATILSTLQPRLDEFNAGQSDETGLSNPYFLFMFAGIYAEYQQIIQHQAAYDFDDLIWEAAELVESRPDFAVALSQRWPYILEDEAQDSVPLQELLLQHLSAPTGNLVRVGDPNQAITSSFTASHPRHFINFIQESDVDLHPLPNSGRCAPLILNAANALLHWVINQHPVPEVRGNTFLEQEILPTPAGDAQPNPPDSEADIRIKVYRNREENEIPDVARLAMRYTEKFPDRTIAILVPTNDVGHKIGEILDTAEINYDNLLRGGHRERRIATALHALLAVLADPLNRRSLVQAHDALFDIEHASVFVPRPDPENPEAGSPFQKERFQAILRSVHSPELLLYPQQSGDVSLALPDNVASEDDLILLDRFAAFIQRIFALRPMPVDDLALALGDELFATGAGDEQDLALAYQIASIMRRWRDAEPDWRLPELVAQLAEVAEGRRLLPLTDIDTLGYEPEAGRITLITQHKAKGLEWDAVFLVSIDARWLPGSLTSYFQGTHDFLGGNPEAQAKAELIELMSGESTNFPERTATETANIEVISERLRLFYVALTRARRFLYISRSRATRNFNREFPSEPASAMAVLYQYLQRTGR